MSPAKKQGIARCGGNTLLHYMPVRRKGHCIGSDRMYIVMVAIGNGLPLQFFFTY